MKVFHLSAYLDRLLRIASVFFYHVNDFESTWSGHYLQSKSTGMGIISQENQSRDCKKSNLF
jgi:hypothetical protein